MTATITRCSDCGAPLTDPNAVMFGLCVRHLDDWFAAAVANAPKTFHPTSAHIASASVNGRARLAARDAAREAAHGYSVENELRQIGPEPSDACPDCGGDGWLPVEGGDAYVECNCQAVS
jgi:hypothetical protein